MDDLPPPPYSAEDPHNQNNTPPLIPEQIQSFNAFIPEPPQIQTSSFVLHHGTSAGPSSAHRPAQTPTMLAQHLERAFPSNPPSTARSLDTPILLPTPSSNASTSNTNEELSKSGFVSALPYFELRAPTLARPIDTLFHHLIITPDSGPDTLSFPQPAEIWLKREVDAHDWMTFVNHLFPYLGVKETEKQELESDAAVSEDLAKYAFGEARPFTRGAFGAGPASEAGSSRPEQSRPLLARARASVEIRSSEPAERLRLIRIHSVIDQWNGGFFRPRGLTVTAETSRVPAPDRTDATNRRPSTNVLQKRPPPGATETLLHQAVGRGKKSEVLSLLLKGNEDLEALDKKGETALFRAVSKGEKAIVQLLLEHGANPNVRGGSDRNTTLYIAVNNDKKTILKYLLEKSTAAIEEGSFTGETPLYLAVRKQRTSCVEVLLEHGASPNSRPLGQESMLNVAVNFDQKSLVKLLLPRGINIEERNKDGDTPLCRAVSRGNTSMVKILLEHGADHGARSSKGEAPLSIAASRADSSIVLLLLAKKDIDIEPENAKGETPLYTSISRGDTSIAEQLLRKGANSSHVPLDQESMLNIAVARGSTSLTSLLLQRGANVEDKNRSRDTPLFQAVGRGDTSIVSLLLAKGADANTRSGNGEPALYKAVTRGDTSIVSLLLGAGANPEISAPAGEAPLYRAVVRGDTSIVSLLLTRGARTDTRSPGGEVPLYRAVSRNDRSIASLLLGNGADPDATCVGDFGDTVLEYAEKRSGARSDGMVQLLSLGRRPPVPVKK